MRKNLSLTVAIFLTLCSAVFLLIGIWINNNTVKLVGLILIVITSFVNFLRAVNKWDKDK